MNCLLDSEAFGMIGKDLREAIDHLNVWKRGGQRAPHKPLLILYAIGRLVHGAPRLIPYREVQENLQDLLREFGPSRQSYHPEYPFWRLQHDDIWQVTSPKPLRRRTAKDDPLKSELLKYDVKGGFTEPVYNLLKENRRLLSDCVLSVLEAHFPSSLHQEILERVGLSLRDYRLSIPRDPRFRIEVLRAYDFKCAVCKYEVRLGGDNLGLEAAHLKWHQAGGPDAVNNGLCLCAIHHRALDRGAFTLSDNFELVISSDLTGGDSAHTLFLNLAGIRITPQTDTLLPDLSFIKWHRREVFRWPDRERVLG